MEKVFNDERQWRHQEEAMERFLEKRSGILEMATGTGKTYTAIRIMKTLLDKEEIKRIIVIAYGTDLLQQWYQELLLRLYDIKIFRFFDRYKEYQKFLLSNGKSVLILSRDTDRIEECLYKLEAHDGAEPAQRNTLLLFDEVHGMGSPEIRKSLRGKLRKYTFRLGLSATPERAYDEEGNEFLKNEVGEVIYRFGLREAVEKGILCPFTYWPVFYQLTDEERLKKKKIIASYEIKRKKGIDFEEYELYMDLARVNKTAAAKIPLFQNIIREKPELLHDCIIFVETKEYGLELQKMLSRYIYRYHTYYSEDAKENLVKFGEGEIDCIITCRKIAEGIDIRTVKNIVLFSSDKGKTATIQRIGRSLRKNPEEPLKKACIVDFICGDQESDDTTDRERMEWMTGLAEMGE